MYICKECQSRYEQKPDYCECGNNTFEYIEEKRSLTLEEKSEIISGIFLALCIILSIIIWLIPIKGEPETIQDKPKQKQAVNIPDINKIWDDTPVYQAPKQEAAPVSEPIVLTPVPVRDFVNETVKKVIKTDKKKEVNKPPKTVEPPKKIKTPVSAETPKPKAEQKINKEQAENVSEPQKVETPKPSYNPNSPAMLRYKANLRALLFSKFAVGSIQGSGSCSIQFSVDSTGKLINRKFSKESDNKSLNDTVYYMLMSVPRFSPPPDGYNGETIRMNFSVTNGNYEISIY